MKKLIALLLALVMCFGACAVAEEEDGWTDYQAILMSVLYENTTAVLESDASRVVAMACTVLDYAMNQPSAYSIGGGDTYYVIGDGEVVLFGCPLTENADGMTAVLIVYDFASRVYSMYPSKQPLADIVDGLTDVAGLPYALTNTSVAEAAELIVEMVTAE